jgi:hypothetical protein
MTIEQEIPERFHPLSRATKWDRRPLSRANPT